jgi:hypothetical protein
MPHLCPNERRFGRSCTSFATQDNAHKSSRGYASSIAGPGFMYLRHAVDVTILACVGISADGEARVSMNFKTRSPRKGRKPATRTRAKRPTTYNGLLMHELGMPRNILRNRSTQQSNELWHKDTLFGGQHWLASAVIAAIWVQQVRHYVSDGNHVLFCLLKPSSGFRVQSSFHSRAPVHSCTRDGWWGLCCKVVPLV